MGISIIKHKETAFYFKGKRLILTLLIAAGHTFCCLYHLLINLTDQLYAELSDPVSTIILNYASQYLSSRYLQYTAVALYAISIIIVLIKKRGKMAEIPVTMLMLLHLAVSIILGYVTGKGFPAGRGLIPAVPLLALSVDEIISSCTGILKIRNVWAGRAATLTAVILLAVTAGKDMKSGVAREWAYTAGDEAYVYSVLYQNEKIDQNRGFSNEVWIRYGFYAEKINYYHGYDVWEGRISDPVKYYAE